MTHSSTCHLLTPTSHRHAAGEVASPNSSRDDDDDYNDDLGEEDTDLDHDGQSAPATLERTNPCVQEDAYAYIDQVQ